MKKNPTLIIAHRGESHDAPENTLASVNLAWARGADAVEIDIRLSRDDAVVVFHDEDTGRLGGRNTRVRDQTLEELKTLDVGKHKGMAWEGEKIPTFEEVLETRPKQNRLFVEIKCGPEIIPPLQAVLHKYRPDMDRLIFFIGLDLDTMRAVKAAFPKQDVYWVVELGGGRKSNLVHRHVEALIDKALRARMNGLDVCTCRDIDRTFVRKVKDAGLSLYVWTVNHHREAARLVHAGVDGITTDRAQWLKRQLEGQKTGSPEDQKLRS